MPAREVWTFFYGSYMNLDVLREVDLLPARQEVGVLRGWRLSIRPLANLAPREGGEVHGLLATATHAELERLYAHARDVLGGNYLPEPVVVEGRSGTTRPALTYVSWDLAPEPAAADYVERILAPARELGFPPAYLEHLAGFRP